MASALILDELDFNLASARLLVCRLRAIFVVVVATALDRVVVVDKAVAGLRCGPVGHRLRVVRVLGEHGSRTKCG